MKNAQGKYTGQVTVYELADLISRGYMPVLR